MSDSDKALEYLKWQSLVNRRETAMLMNLSRDALKDNARNFFKNYCTLNSSVHSRITRQMNMLHLPRIRTLLS